MTDKNEFDNESTPLTVGTVYYPSMEGVGITLYRMVTGKRGFNIETVEQTSDPITIREGEEVVAHISDVSDIKNLYVPVTGKAHSDVYVLRDYLEDYFSPNAKTRQPI